MQFTKKLNILFITDSHFDSDSRVQKMVKVITDQGHRVTVCHRGHIRGEPSSQSLISFLETPRFDQYVGRAKHLISKFRRPKTVQSTSHPTKIKSDAWLKLISTLARAYLIKKNIINRKSIRFQEYDLVHANEFTALSTAYYLNKHYKIPFIYDSHEYEIGLFFDSKFCPAVIQFFEKKYIRRASAVATVSDDIALKLSEIYSIPIPSVIYNSPAISPTSSSIISIRSGANIPINSKIIIYVGGLAPRRGLFEIIESLKYLDEYCLLHISRRKKEIDSLITEHATKHNVIDKIFLLPPAEHDEVINIIQGADLGLLVHHNICENTNFALPNKLFEMVFANLPIVYSNQLHSISRFMKRYKIGIEIDEINAKNIAQGIKLASAQNFLTDEHTFETIKQQYGWDTQAKKLIDIYSNIPQLQISPQETVK